MRRRRRTKCEERKGHVQQASSMHTTQIGPGGEKDKGKSKLKKEAKWISQLTSSPQDPAGEDGER